MVKEYKWRTRVRSGESDIWGTMPPSDILRLMEETAVVAAADLGYGREFHEREGTAWVVHRMIFSMLAPARAGDELGITTWASHFSGVRGGREYRILNESTGLPVASGLAEWVYVDRRKQTPMRVPVLAGADFDIPGAPLGNYDPPPVERIEPGRDFVYERRAEWFECDSMVHVNNTVYADWLDAGLRHALEESGWPIAALMERGLQLRGEHFDLQYKRPVRAGDSLRVTTRCAGVSGRLCLVEQTIAPAEGGSAYVVASTVYGWTGRDGSPAEAPEGWLERGLR